MTYTYKKKRKYRRKKGSNIYHWRRDCPDLPTEDFVETHSPKAGKLCEKCLAKERQDEEI